MNDRAAPADSGALLRSVGRAAGEVGAAAYVVGGAVRDALLGRATRDVDVAVESDAEGLLGFLDLLGRLPGVRQRARHERFGTATFETAGGLRLDVAAARRESYPRPAALPVVVTGAPIGEDLARRDFTIHAMARRLGARGEQGPLLDPHGGTRDLEGRTLRLLHDASLVDDPTRIFRAARYAARLGFGVSPEFPLQLAACRRARALEALSADRLRRALGEVLEEEPARVALALLSEWGVLGDLANGLAPPPALPPAVEAGERWSALVAPLAPPARKAFAERLNFPRALRRAVGLSV